MTTLVTGATGFTGSHLVQALVRRGERVRVLLRPTSDLTQLAGLDVEVVRGDIRDSAAVEQAVRGADIVYHLAACFREAGAKDSVYHDVHVEGTGNVLRAACKYGVGRVVHCSTGGVHGHITNPPADENAPLNPGDIYQETKLQGEQLAFAFHKREGLPVAVVRPTGIYGPGDLRMLKFYQLVQRRRFVMLGAGRALYHFTYISDLVEGFLLAAQNEKAVGQAYLIGGERYLTLSEWVNMLAEELRVPSPRYRLPVGPFYALAAVCETVCPPLGVAPPFFRRRVDIFTKDRAFDITKAKQELNFRPQVDLKTGIHRTAEWYKEQGHLRA